MAKYTVTANWLRLRAGPGTNHGIIKYLAKNSIVEGSEQTNGWMRVTDADGKSGWISAKYLSQIEDPIPQPIPALASLSAFSVTADALNMRQGPGVNHAIIGSLSKSELVEGVAQSTDGQWVQIKKENGLVGWCSTKHLTKVLTLPLPTGEAAKMIVTADILNIRSGPSFNYSVKGRIRQGEVVNMVGTTKDWTWAQVKTSGFATGWCPSKYLIEKELLSVPTDDLAVLGKQRLATYVMGLREQPGPEQRVLVTLNFNQVVEVDQVSADGLWKHCTTAQGQSGWGSSVHLASLQSLGSANDNEEFPWMPIAFEQLGTSEVPGKGSNPRILGYLASTELFIHPYLPDETDWCAAFVNWCIKKTGIKSANSALAFAWTRWGKPLATPRRGCVVAFQWDNRRQHVSFYLGEISNYVVALGGNQNDAVWINVYHKRNVLGYRIPSNWPDHPSAI